MGYLGNHAHVKFQTCLFILNLLCFLCRNFTIQKDVHQLSYRVHAGDESLWQKSGGEF